jgi:hypothetical protein
MVGSMVAAAYLTAGTFSYAAVAFAVNFAVSMIVTRVFGQDQQGPQDSGTREQVPPSNTNAIPVVYGDAYLGGTFVDAVLSTDQKTMYYVMAVSCISPNGQFTFDTTDMYYGDRLITFDGTDQTKVVSLTDEAGNVDDKISGNLYISLYKSSASGTITSLNGASAPNVVMGGSDIDAALRWPSTGRQMNGLAFAIIKLNYNTDAGTTNLSPITFKASHYLNSTGVAKPGDVWYDYITNTAYGGAVDTAFVDTASVTAINSYADGLITYTPSGGGSATEARYRINGVIDAGQTVLSNLDKVMTCCDSWMAYNAAAGQWSIVINKSESAAYSFDDDNIIGEIRVSATDITQSINQVEAKFPNGESRDQPDFVNIATPTGLLYPNEPVNKYSVSYDLVNDSVRAQYLANRILEQAREDLIVSFSTTYYGIQVDAGSVVSVTNSDYGWSNKLFRVVKVNEASLPNGSLGAKLEMTEYSAAVYDDFDITQYTPVPNSDIPSPIYFSALSTPTVVSNNYNVTPPTFTVRVTVPAVGRVTYGTLYYTTSASPTGFDWKELAKATTPLGTAAVNGATYDFASLTLAGGTYYFSYVVGNEIGQSAKSATSSAFSWSPINSESGNVAYLQGEIDTLGIDVADKVSKTTANILTGTITPQDSGGIKVGSITWSSSTGQLTGGSGIAITEAGIIGAKSGVANFTIDTSGNALFKGDINTNGDAYFEGSNPSVTSVFIDGQNYTIDYSSYSRGATQPTVLNSARVGTFGYAQASPYVGSGYTGWNVGTMGVGKNFFGAKGIGLVGQGDEFGAYISGYTAGLVCSASTGSVSNVAFQINNNGRFVWNGYYIDAPTGSTSLFLRNDGTWATAGAGAGVSSFNSRTGAVTFQTSDMTGTAPGSAYYLSGSGWASVNPIMTTATANSGSATVSGNNMNLLGSTSTGIAGAYVGTSGSGSTVTFTVQTTSPSDIRLKEEVADADVGLEFVKNLRPVSYKLKADPRHQKGYGFIADEVEQLGVYGSSLVYEEPNWQVGDEVGFKTIHYPSYIAVLTKAVQELSAKVDEQQKMIEALQNKG